MAYDMDIIIEVSREEVCEAIKKLAEEKASKGFGRKVKVKGHKPKGKRRKKLRFFLTKHRLPDDEHLEIEKEVGYFYVAMPLP